MVKNISKKILTGIMSVLCAMCLFGGVSYAQSAQTIIDEAGFLTPSQLSELSARLEDIRDKYDFDVAVVTEEYMSGSDEASTADDIFDYNNYGCGSGKDGVLFYISESPRNYRVLTHGYGETVFTSRGNSHMNGIIEEELQNDNYYAAIKAYADLTEEYLRLAGEGRPYNEHTPMENFITWALAIGVPLLIAVIATSSKSKKMNTAVRQDYANSYMKSGSMNINVSKDIFLYSIVNRTEKPKSDSGSHTSSSGEHHGGFGGSY